MLHIIHDGFPNNVIVINTVGEVSDKDYEEVLLPAIKNRLQQHDDVRLLFVFGFEFKDFDTDALWGDLLLGINDLSNIKKLAVVSNLKWIEKGIKLFSIFIPASVRFYNEEKFMEAKAWVSETL